jgi:ketosteroid isomerase-like protein
MSGNVTVDDDVKAIKELGEEYFEAANLGDANRCIATMAPDVVIMPAGRPSIVGSEELRHVSHDYHAKFKLNYTLVYDEVEVIGDLAFARATSTGTPTASSDGSVENLILAISPGLAFGA